MCPLKSWLAMRQDFAEQHRRRAREVLGPHAGAEIEALGRKMKEHREPNEKDKDKETSQRHDAIYTQYHKASQPDLCSILQATITAIHTHQLQRCQAYSPIFITSRWCGTFRSACSTGLFAEPAASQSFTSTSPDVLLCSGASCCKRRVDRFRRSIWRRAQPTGAKTAVAVRNLHARHPHCKVAILDLDAHFGDGTAWHFYEDWTKHYAVKLQAKHSPSSMAFQHWPKTGPAMALTSPEPWAIRSTIHGSPGRIYGHGAGHEPPTAARWTWRCRSSHLYSGPDHRSFLCAGILWRRRTRRTQVFQQAPAREKDMSVKEKEQPAAYIEQQLSYLRKEKPLTDAQKDTQNKIMEALKEGKIPLLDGVTGCGKTRILEHVIAELKPKAALVLAPVKELAKQKLGCRLGEVHLPSEGIGTGFLAELWLKD
eukprot:g23727.t1